MTPRELVAAVRVHLDRVHDSVRRVGCGPATAVALVESSALEVVDRAADGADTLPELIGWWFARAREAAVEAAGGPAEDHSPGGAPSHDSEQRRLEEALAWLAEELRTALVLHDTYELPVSAVSAALGTDDDEALALVGQARLELAARLEGGPTSVLAAHQADPAALTRLAGPADGRPSPGTTSRDATARRHALSCASCGSVIEIQRRIRSRVAGLAITPLPRPARDAVLDHVEQEAHAALASGVGLFDGVGLLADDVVGPHRRRTFSPLLVFLGLLVAAAAGLGIGLLLLDDGPADTRAARDEQLRALPSRQPAAPQVLVSPPVVQPPAPQTSVFLVPEPSPAAMEPPAAEELPLAVQPSTGGNGADLFVTGTGWMPEATVVISYLGVDGRETGSQATEQVDAGGRFGVDLAAEDPADRPGRHIVRVTDGARTLAAPYDVEE